MSDAPRYYLIRPEYIANLPAGPRPPDPDDAPIGDHRIRVHLLDTETGERIANEQVSYCGSRNLTRWWWTEGNGGCDCNRAREFGHEPPYPCTETRYKLERLEFL